MGVFRFHLVSGPPVDLEIAASTISELYTIVSCQRFIEGHMTESDSHGVLPGVLIATSRIQCVVEVS